MRNIFYIFAIMAITLTSCDNKENLKPSNQIAIERIKQNAKSLSLSHDSLVLEMIKVEKQKIKQKIKSSSNVESNLNISEVCDVIEEVTGIRPIVLSNNPSGKQMLNSINNEENLSINFDVDKLNLADYATSDVMADYLKQIDNIKQDSTKIIAQKIVLISEIQIKIVQDSNATIEEIELFFNTTEILKGSLSLWNNENSMSLVKQNISGIYYSKPITKWGFFAKLGFVAAADALGAVLGTFVGGVVTVGGVPMYVPSGPTGTVVSAAVLSYIAAKMVGW